MSRESPVVLVVDDNKAIANTYTAFLTDEYTVRTAYDGRDALEELGPDVDVVLLDRRMPEISGDAVLEEIESRQLDCRVVMLTAVDPDFDIIDMGFDEYLVKPIERQELNDVVDAMVDRASFDDDFRRFLALLSKKQTLEREKSSAELEASEEYQQVLDRMEDRRAAVGIDLTQFEETFEVQSGTVRVPDEVRDELDDEPGASDSDEPDD